MTTINYKPASEAVNGDKFAVRAINNEGRVQFYTGRAGEYMLGDQPFTYETANAAAYRVKTLAPGSPIHGWYFMVVALPA